MDKEKLNLKKYLILIAFALVGLWIVNNLNVVGSIFNVIISILFPFILGGALAFLLNIPMSFFERKYKKIKNKKILRIVSLIFAIVVILFVIILMINLIVPELIDVVKLLIDNIPYYAEEINNLIQRLELDIPDINSINMDTETLKNQVMEYMPNLIASSVSIISNIVSAVSSLFIAIIFSIYILLDKEKLQLQFTKMIKAYLGEKRSSKIINICKEASKVFRKFFTIQCLEATILGSLCIIGMLILRIPYAIPIGILIGVTALIPVLGAFIGVAVGAVLIVAVNPIKVVTFVIFVLILQQIEGNIIYPKVVGNSVGLPGIWVLAAVTLGGSIGGILGMLLGVPVATTIYNLLARDVNKKLKASKKIIKIHKSINKI